MKKLSLRTLIQNLYSLWVYDYHRADNELKSQINVLERNLRWTEIKNEILSHPQFAASYPELQLFLNTPYQSSLVLFPYKQLKALPSIIAEYDTQLQLPYIIHKTKRLYYPHSYTLEACQNAYRFLIEQDQILEGGYLEKAPHCYQTETFKVEKGDVLVDGGAAEGLFTLENIEKVSRAIMIEADKKWLPALKATFAPWKEKVTIINKYLSQNTDNQHITIPPPPDGKKTLFVKMDIEGAEVEVIEGAKELLKLYDNYRLVCCTYHYQDDAEKLSKLFDEIGYEYEFSDGWLFFAEYDMPEPPYLRHVLIRAQKKK